MSLPDKLLEKLVCPQCHGALDYDKQKDKLTCPKCRLVYRVANDIPVLVVEEAEKL